MKKNALSEILRSILFVIIPIILYLVIQSAVSLICSGLGMQPAVYSIAGCVICILILYPFFYLPLKSRLIIDGYRKETRIQKKMLVWVVLAGVCACFVLNGIVVMIQLNKMFTSYESVAQVLYDGNILIIALQMIIAAPIAEELVFRGIVYQGLKPVLGRIMAAVLSALLFGILHGNLLQALYAFALGVFLSLLFEKYQSLKPCILFHMSANAFSVIGTKTALISFVFSSWWIILFYTVICSMLLIISILKIITNKCVY